MNKTQIKTVKEKEKNKKKKNNINAPLQRTEYQ